MGYDRVLSGLFKKFSKIIGRTKAKCRFRFCSYAGVFPGCSYRGAVCNL